MTDPDRSRTLRRMAEEAVDRLELADAESDVFYPRGACKGIQILMEFAHAVAAAVRQEQQALIAKLRNAARQVKPCEICEWPQPMNNEHFICECCGFQPGYDDASAYQWDGTWWAGDESRQPKILRDGGRRA